MRALSVLYDLGTGEAYLKLKIVQTLQWSDPRLADPTFNPCKEVNHLMLTVSRDEAISDQDRVEKTRQRSHFYTPEPM
eukprot:5438118-Prymnesium_polylepis.2